LFANITAGHIIVLSFLGLVFIFKTIAVAAFGVPFALFISILELFVALLQAYVFTLLTALYFGSAVHAHEHDDDHAQGHEAAH
jgi:F-type H+-transporting ATPase subunit a